MLLPKRRKVWLQGNGAQSERLRSGIVTPTQTLFKYPCGLL